MKKEFSPSLRRIINYATWLIKFVIGTLLWFTIGALILGGILFLYKNYTSSIQITLNKQCSDSARDYFIKMKPPAKASDDVTNPYTLQQSLFNSSLNTCVLEVTYGSVASNPIEDILWGNTGKDIVYDVYKNKELASNEININSKVDTNQKPGSIPGVSFDNTSNQTTSFCTTWIGNERVDGCPNANNKFADYKTSIGL